MILHSFFSTPSLKIFARINFRAPATKLRIFGTDFSRNFAQIEALRENARKSVRAKISTNNVIKSDGTATETHTHRSSAQKKIIHTFITNRIKQVQHDTPQVKHKLRQKHTETNIQTHRHKDKHIK